MAAATEKMNQAWFIGEDGVKNLKEFAESSRLLGNEFKKTMTKIQAALAPFLINSLQKQQVQKIEKMQD